MKKKYRYYYVVASFMRKDKEYSTKIDFTFRTDNGSGLFPIMQAITCITEKFSDTAIPETIQFDSYFEISKGDYEAFNKFKEFKLWRSVE